MLLLLLRIPPYDACIIVTCKQAAAERSKVIYFPKRKSRFTRRFALVMGLERGREPTG